MKKKLLSLMMCGVLVFASLSLTACGDEVEGDDTQNVVVDNGGANNVAGDEAVSDETWAGLQELYGLLVETYNATVDLYNDNSIMPNAEVEDGLTTAKELIELIGNVERDEVTEASAIDWVNSMLAVNEIFGAVLETVQSTEDEAAQIAAGFNSAYAGVTTDENTYAYIGFGEDVAALMFYNVSTNASGSFVGPFEIDEETGVITINDTENGMAISFTVETVETGYYLDMGDFGAAYVETVSAEDLAKAYVSISIGSVPQF